MPLSSPSGFETKDNLKTGFYLHFNMHVTAPDAFKISVKNPLTSDVSLVLKNCTAKLY